MTNATPSPDLPAQGPAEPDKPWFVYLVRAANGSLYCGISDDPVRRFAKHQSGKGARFFLSSPAVALVYTEACRDKGEALRQERLIKKLRKSAKECLVASALSLHQPD
ncbi:MULTISPECIES: GIY-YIG nuclease family protein [Pseudomonas]|uniref:GIY-YIG nuclease family protein n=1 Tax=Pseudomonas bijieensis TaxID=2681983 RepID=A0A6N1CKH8_9PSED|nr:MULTISPECIES: GIY-YIG nuclease family protein [Pseudomonas]AXP05065.1 GIY-YIG nuclease family protein [Pseudomonas fluorescens]PWJ33279.1 putative endonuclease [Pseudomonas sp. 43mfcvi1.1]QIB06965.1 GIY-YIG nuclease family protein [Pseudomonas fluorescens]QKS84846.1 GIY-YIG nuclease family protein [Pseudomonas bijieensis]WLH61866.1 GIY-YIG nuclease family protein [Pseudomonas sp. FP2300]